MSVKFEFDVRVDSKKLYHQKLFLMQKLQSYFKKQVSICFYTAVLSSEAS